MTTEVKVDVIIPVYNAFPYVEKCVKSISKYIDKKIDKVIIYNDCSTQETARQLDALNYEKLQVVHGEVNLGFGGAVNSAFQYTTNDYVLVLNSDTEASDDFLSDLIKLLDSDCSIAAVNPIQDKKYNDKYKGYANDEGYVRNYQLSGYAFLIRKNIFEEVGGFRKDFGRGYFEDNALARDICKKNYNTGICITSLLTHAVSKSFDVSKIKAMMDKNEVIFENLYPESKRRVLVLGKISSKAMSEVEDVCRNGGRVYLYGHRAEDSSGLCPRIQNVTSLFKLISLVNRYIIRGQKRRNQISDIWLTENTGVIENKLISILASIYKVENRNI